MTAPRHQPLYLAIDFGTTVTVAAGVRPGGEPELVRFGADSWMPSAVHVGPGGTLSVGREAAAATAADPLGGQLTPKALLGTGAEVEWLRGRPVPLVHLVAQVLRAAYAAACEQLGEPTRVALTCPVAWAPAGPQAVKRPTLRAAAQLAGLPGDVVVLDEAEAAAHHIGGGALPVEEDELFALYDLGGGTCDIAVLRRDQGRLAVVALAGAEVGGEHFDWLLHEHVLGRLDPAAAASLRDAGFGENGDGGWRRCQAELGVAVREAKEHLGERAEVDIEVPPPAGGAVTVTAGTLEEIVAPDVERTAEELRAAVDRALELPHHGDGIAAVHVVGGASLLPVVPRVLERLTGVPARRAERPREAVALGAAHALEAWSGAGRPTRRAGARHEELHARRVIACAAMGSCIVLLHRDAAGAPMLSRLDPARGAADRSVAVGLEEPTGATAGPGLTVAWGVDRIQVWDPELRPVPLPDDGRVPGELRAVHASATGAWILYGEPAGPLRLRTIAVPPADAPASPAVRDLVVVPGVSADSSRPGGCPGLVAGAHGDRLTIAVRVGDEQQVFVAAADGRMRKLESRAGAPWLLDRIPTAHGSVEVVGGMGEGGERLPSAVRLRDASAVEVDGRLRPAVVVAPLGGAGLVAVGARAGGWEAYRIDPTARAAVVARVGGTVALRGVHALCGDPTATLLGQPPLPTPDGVWLSVTTSEGTSAAELVRSDGRRDRTATPAGARPVLSAAGRLYVQAGDELRSVAVTPPAPRSG